MDRTVINKSIEIAFEKAISELNQKKESLLTCEDDCLEEAIYFSMDNHDSMLKPVDKCLDSALALFRRERQIAKIQSEWDVIYDEFLKIISEEKA